mmetsp:Transcript_9138/g.27161  ORF Transcript_9138/g.27161 Transcript_9138/m.27161 type:complete len:360 (+) Transcript_9138:1686-2765(+)
MRGGCRFLFLGGESVLYRCGMDVVVLHNVDPGQVCFQGDGRCRSGSDVAQPQRPGTDLSLEQGAVVHLHGRPLGWQSLDELRGETGHVALDLQLEVHRFAPRLVHDVGSCIFQQGSFDVKRVVQPDLVEKLAADTQYLEVSLDERRDAEGQGEFSSCGELERLLGDHEKGVGPTRLARLDVGVGDPAKLRNCKLQILGTRKGPFALGSTIGCAGFVQPYCKFRRARLSVFGSGTFGHSRHELHLGDFDGNVQRIGHRNVTKDGFSPRTNFRLVSSGLSFRSLGQRSVLLFPVDLGNKFSVPGVRNLGQSHRHGFFRQGFGLVALVFPGLGGVGFRYRHDFQFFPYRFVTPGWNSKSTGR